MPKKLLPNWDLVDLYQSISDPKINKDIQTLLKQAKEFNKKNKNKLQSLLSGKRGKKSNKLLTVLRQYEQILQNAVKPLIYAQLIFSQNSSHPKHGAFMQDMRAKYLAIHQLLLFFELQLLQLPSKALSGLIKDKTLTNYHHFLKLLLINKPHRLSETEEKIFNDKTLTGSGAFVRLFDEELARKKFEITIGKKKKVFMVRSSLLMV